MAAPADSRTRLVRSWPPPLATSDADNVHGKVPAPFGFDGRQPLVVEHNGDVELGLEHQGFLGRRLGGRAPVSRKAEREPDHDKTGVELRHERRNRLVINLWQAASYDHRMRACEDPARIADRDSDTAMAEVDADDPLSRSRSRGPARLADRRSI